MDLAAPPAGRAKVKSNGTAEPKRVYYTRTDCAFECDHFETTVRLLEYTTLEVLSSQSTIDRLSDMTRRTVPVLSPRLTRAVRHHLSEVLAHLDSLPPGHI